MTGNPLVALGALGQSPWLDFIERELIGSGELARLVAEDGIRGVTSNPTIFEKAISGGRAYDGQVRELAAARAEVLGAYTALAAEDIRRAADVLRPVYDRTSGGDGYVSLEVDPDLAHDADRTVARAKELFRLVSRPNTMIKVPATPEGLPAVEELIASGVPVNVTLIFSVRTYEGVARAYQRGVRRLVEGGGDPARVASVASFFVSRVDTAVDRLLDGIVSRWPGSPKAKTAGSLYGKVAIANARLAYARFRRLFSGAEWGALAAKGARVQRPLWASTGTKNPAYPDVYYVEELAGPDTVNTMPPQTMDAFRDHGTVGDRLTGRDGEATKILSDLGMLEIGIEEVCETLLSEGVKSFLDSYRNLLAAVGKRLAAEPVR